MAVINHTVVTPRAPLQTQRVILPLLLAAKPLLVALVAPVLRALVAAHDLGALVLGPQRRTEDGLGDAADGAGDGLGDAAHDGPDGGEHLAQAVADGRQRLVDDACVC